MLAMMANRFGGPDVLELVDLPAPEPGRGEVVVDVAAIGVGWLDTLIRSGRGPDVFAVEPPYVPGGAVSGTVVAIGAEVDSTWLGARVVTRSAADYGGGYADTVVANVDFAFLVPDELGLDSAVALLDDGATALALLEKTPVRPGDRVLIAPALGGLGSLAVQLASAAGARVIAAVRGEEKLALARELTDVVVDYSTADWPEQVRATTDGHGLDVVFDGLGGMVGAAAVALLADGGRFSGYGMASGAPTELDDADRQRLTVVDMAQLVEFWPDNARRVARVLNEAAAGRVTPIIGRTYPLAEAAAAHVDIEARRFTGKLLLLP
ncbi:MAG: alcohol dehydrogenase [Amycolatopsis sp.]|uniref:zinc-binding dehydrogenase n=1 Tax=Amycolatopsis sp. TaxID=37632 RepID=UPI00261BF9D0|nr:zinc-binding dehydrogenase [Amycolatopsis sp.]MCU1681150.1 alcohol dehydrogenase [Amycolatopsis sp.]